MYACVQVKIFADDAMPATQAAILALFASADVIVAPHGAGLANLVVAPPCATVIEARSGGHPACYKHLATVLGLRYETACSTDDGNALGLCPLTKTGSIDADTGRVANLVHKAVARVRRHRKAPDKEDTPHGACVASARGFAASHAKATAEIARRRKRRR